MNILFMMPNWRASSEVWMLRMMEALGTDLKAIAVNNSGGELFWKNNVQIYSMNYPAKEIRYFSRLFRFCGFSLRINPPDPNSLIKKLVKRYSITHILCQYGTHAIKYLEILRDLDLPLFVHFHGFDATFDLRSHDLPEKNAFKNDYIEKLKSLSEFAVLIANSQFTRDALISADIDPSRIVIKYLGVPLPDIPHVHQKNKDIQILQLGRLIDCKSPDRTIQAFEMAQAKGLKGKLILAGDGPLRTTCELMKQRSPFIESIEILGSVSWNKAQELLLESDIYTQHNIFGELSHQSEALGVSILEAMSYAVPIVGTRHGGVVETVIDGETGILNEPGDVEAQAIAFLRLANDPSLRQNLGNAGRERVANYFNIEKEAEQLKKIMNVSCTKVQNDS